MFLACSPLMCTCCYSEACAFVFVVATIVLVEGEPKVIFGILPATLISSSYKTVVELVFFFYLRKKKTSGNAQLPTMHLHYREQDHTAKSYVGTQ